MVIVKINTEIVIKHPLPLCLTQSLFLTLTLTITRNLNQKGNTYVNNWQMFHLYLVTFGTRLRVVSPTPLPFPLCTCLTFHALAYPVYPNIAVHAVWQALLLYPVWQEYVPELHIPAVPSVP